MLCTTDVAYVRLAFLPVCDSGQRLVKSGPRTVFFFYDHARVIVLLRKILIFSVSINRKYLHFKLFRVSNYPNPMHNLKHNQCVG